MIKQQRSRHCVIHWTCNSLAEQVSSALI